MESVLYPDVSLGTSMYSKRPAVSDIYEIAGRFLLFESCKGALPAGLDRLLAGFYFAHIEEHASVTPDAIIGFQPDDYTAIINADFDRFEVSEGGHCYTDGDTYLFNFDSARVVVHPGPSPRVDILMKKDLDLSRAEHVQVFNYAISAALRRCGLYELHSAAVVEPQTRKGFLFVGPSGSGKSTLTLQLAAAGWPYLTDDIVLLSLDREIVAARPLRRAFAVTDATVSASGHRGLKEAVTTLDRFDASKKRFAPRDFFPDGFASTCIPRVVFFPVIAQQDRSNVRELSRSEAMIKLVRMCPWASYDHGTGGDHLGTLGALAKQCQTFELLAGRDLLQDPARVSALVMEQIACKS